MIHSQHLPSVARKQSETLDKGEVFFCEQGSGGVSMPLGWVTQRADRTARLHRRATYLDSGVAFQRHLSHVRFHSGEDTQP